MMLYRNIHNEGVKMQEPNLDQPDYEEDEDLETEEDWFDDEDEDINLDSEEEDAS